MERSGIEGGEFFRDVFPGDTPPRINAFMRIDPREICLTDTTLRDGQQGWRTLTVSEALKLYEVLVELAEGGTILSTELFPYTGRDKEIVKEIKDVGANYPKPIGWVRARKKDVRLAKEAGLDEIVMLASISDYHIVHKFGLARREVFEKYLDAIRYAYNEGLSVRVTLEDVTRADLKRAVIPFMKMALRLAESFGEELRFKLADTLGLGLPLESVPPPRGIPQIISAVIDELGIKPGQLEFHGHNDLGLVVSNHLAAWIYGAGLSNCTLFGIGERAGNCPLEIMMIHYVGLTGKKANLKAIKKAAAVVRGMGFEIPEFYPLVGANAFRTKAGIHVDGLMKNPEVYLPFNPLSVLGIPYTVSITPYSGRSAVALWMNRYVSPYTGIRYGKNHTLVIKVYDEIVSLFERSGRRHPLTDEELWNIVYRYIPNLPRNSRSVGSAEELS